MCEVVSDSCQWSVNASACIWTGVNEVTAITQQSEPLSPRGECSDSHPLDVFYARPLEAAGVLAACMVFVLGSRCLTGAYRDRRRRRALTVAQRRNIAFADGLQLGVPNAAGRWARARGDAQFEMFESAHSLALARALGGGAGTLGNPPWAAASPPPLSGAERTAVGGGHFSGPAVGRRLFRDGRRAPSLGRPS